MEEGFIFPHLIEAMKIVAEFTKEQYIKELQGSNRPTKENTLIKNMEIVTNFEGREYWIGLKLQDYWKYIEFDTKPHMPPVSSIMKWVEIKPVLPKPEYSNLPKPKQIERTAWGIAKGIEKHGTKGSHDMQKMLDITDERYYSILEEAIEKDISEMGEELLKSLV